MKKELAEVLDAELRKIYFIEVLNKDVTFSNEKLKDKSIARFEATILAKDTVINDEALKALVIQHLKDNMAYPDQEVIHQVYEIRVVTD